ncbi:MAG TPA: hypothetical protein VN417_05030, partial [Candidatus Cryosericum sp.]|nr:hypothetical protein [Candidatus Cryosericum sp.]
MKKPNLDQIITLLVSALLCLSFVACSNGVRSLSSAAGQSDESTQSKQEAIDEPVAIIVLETSVPEAETPNNDSSFATPSVTEVTPSTHDEISAPNITGYENWASSEALEALLRVLSLEEPIKEGCFANRTAYSIQQDALYYLNEVANFLDYSFIEPLLISRYAFTDMDNDGQPEALIEMENSADYWYKV